ncbi:MAG TPA: flagellar biosynthesis protein FlgL [Vulgatibacter sp.]|nr:flagellar biosynthesis protein FlgL [Vulgatibacter sp.]
MRVTDRLLFESASRYAGIAREKMDSAQREVHTGLRVRHPGDDPTAAGLIVAGRSNVERLQSLSQTMGRVSDELLVADTALAGVTTSLMRIQQLATSLGNETNGPEALQAGALEVDALRQNILSLLNTQSSGRYIFGGNQDAAPPFDPSGAYLGDAGVRQVEIAPGIYQTFSVRMDEAIAGAGGAVDVMATIQDLIAALQAGDNAAVRSTLDDLQRSITQVAGARTRIGASMSIIEAAMNVGGMLEDGAVEGLARLTDADQFESMSKLVLAQRALDAALTASASSFRLTIIDKLR